MSSSTSSATVSSTTSSRALSPHDTASSSSSSPALHEISKSACPTPKEQNNNGASSSSTPSSSFSSSRHPASRSPPSESTLAKILELEEIDVNMYRGTSPESPRWGRIYGGQTVAQALVASCRTVDPSCVVHSLHAYFLRPGNDDLPILYIVERLRNGKSFSSRRVTAYQKGNAIFAMMVSFMTAEVGLEHQDTMPVVPPPKGLESLTDSYREILKDPRLTPKVKKGLERSMALPFPVDILRIKPVTLAERLKPAPPDQQFWIRVSGQLSDSLMIHQCALAYMSDWSLLETSLLPHGLHGWLHVENATALQMASIDHSMWFHRPFRADEWLLFDMHSESASGGRGHARGRFFNRDGQLLVSVAQEGLIRVIKGPAQPMKVGPRAEKTKKEQATDASKTESGQGKQLQAKL